MHLSKKDYTFFNNLSFIIKDKQQITSNQNSLFDKLIAKYQKQLRKHGHELSVLQKLNWDVLVVQTSEEYLIPKIYLDETDTLCLRTPFNESFIRGFSKRSVYAGEYTNPFKWDKDKRIYTSKFYTHALRVAYDNCFKYWDTIEYCDRVKEIITPLFDSIDTCTPYLVKENNTYYIQNLNVALSNALQGVVLNNDPKTIYTLSRYGVSISDDIIDGDDLLKFASQFVATIDIDELLKCDYLTRLGITDVILDLNSKDMLYVELRDYLKNHNITVHPKYAHAPEGSVRLSLYRNFNVYQRYNTLLSYADKSYIKSIYKMVDIKNSRPVHVK